jgi:antitoxin ParD1/3/4
MVLVLVLVSVAWSGCDRELTTVDSSGTIGAVSRNTMSFALPESLRDYIDARVQSGEYGNTSEYLRDLIRRDQRDQAVRRLQELITEGLESGPTTPLTKRRIAELRKQALSA